ncbi:hypothetical protein O7621_11425 [Solwaraspora sp. WMMD937]|uniref:hypothetical protein n=1 Tax=Solwaraspora sp. WMMD937 TaxID=3016090 RepID=UPI00249BAC36|nr:hypothetical protein [Solwaraspora sp. WMMD937]WFE23821.1 hypothetical protein O7621_11425 [Solwaraspora sp. WMMD937]
MTARSGPVGSVELVDDAGAVVASIPPAYLQDSSVDAKTGLPARSAAVTMELAEVDVRDLISGWALGQPNLGLALIDDEQFPAAGARFTSANYGNGRTRPGWN